MQTKHIKGIEQRENWRTCLRELFRFSVKRNFALSQSRWEEEIYTWDSPQQWAHSLWHVGGKGNALVKHHFLLTVPVKCTFLINGIHSNNIDSILSITANLFFFSPVRTSASPRCVLNTFPAAGFLTTPCSWSGVWGSLCASGGYLWFGESDCRECRQPAKVLQSIPEHSVTQHWEEVDGVIYVIQKHNFVWIWMFGLVASIWVVVIRDPNKWINKNSCIVWILTGFTRFPELYSYRSIDPDSTKTAHLSFLFTTSQREMASG